MKILFLDFDGVLNNKKFLLDVGGATYVGLMPEKVELLNRIVEETGVNIVFSTSWKELFIFPKLVNILVTSGFKYPKTCIGLTDPEENNRGYHINQWLQKWHVHYRITGHVIVDDCMDEIQNFPRHVLVETTIEDGLTEEKVEEIISKLDATDE